MNAKEKLTAMLRGEIQSGYTHCACRDCMDVTVSSDELKPELCSLCEEAGCDDGECQRDYADDDTREAIRFLAHHLFSGYERGE